LALNFTQLYGRNCEGVLKKEVKDIEKKLNEIMISYEAASYKD
jgi:hypothetical protein